MEAIQFYPSHPGYLRHHFQHNDSEERDYFKTPQKKTKPRNLSPKRKTHKVEDFN